MLTRKYLILLSRQAWWKESFALISVCKKTLQFFTVLVLESKKMIEYFYTGVDNADWIKGYERCVGLSVLAHNLHVLGNALKAKVEEEKRGTDLIWSLRQAA